MGLYQSPAEKSRLFRKFYNLPDLGHNLIVVLCPMWNQAGGAVLYSTLCIGKIAAALIPQRIERAVAEKAAKLLFIFTLMARKILTFLILEKFIMLHISS